MKVPGIQVYHLRVYFNKSPLDIRQNSLIRLQKCQKKCSGSEWSGLKCSFQEESGLGLWLEKLECKS